MPDLRVRIAGEVDTGNKVNLEALDNTPNEARSRKLTDFDNVTDKKTQDSKMLTVMRQS